MGILRIKGATIDGERAKIGNKFVSTLSCGELATIDCYLTRFRFNGNSRLIIRFILSPLDGYFWGTLIDIYRSDIKSRRNHLAALIRGLIGDSYFTATNVKCIAVGLQGLAIEVESILATSDTVAIIVSNITQQLDVANFR